MGPIYDTRIIDHYVEAFNRHDPEALEPLFAANVTLRDWTIEAKGRAAVLDANRGIFKAVPSISVTVLQRVFGENAAAIELSIDVGEAAPLLVVDVLEFDADGRIITIRAYRG